MKKIKKAIHRMWRIGTFRKGIYGNVGGGGVINFVMGF